MQVWPETVFDVLYVLGFILIPVIITQKKNPVAALAWIMAIILLPLLGSALYLVFGTNRIRNRGLSKLLSNRRLEKRLRQLELDSAPARIPTDHPLPAQLIKIIRVARKFSLFDAMGGNDLEIYVQVEETYRAFEQAICAANHHIFINFYIFHPDPLGARFRDLLIEKSRQGVKVYFLYDSLGSRRLRFSYGFLRTMRENGVRVEQFLPLRIFMKPWLLNLRNHRKLLIVDNQVAFTGSLNVGQGFLSTRQRKWRETSIRIRGPVLAQLAWIFYEDWYTATGELPQVKIPLSDYESAGQNVVQVVASGPDERREALPKTVAMAITGAAKCVYLTTPYFIPDSGLLLALQLAALKGLDVRVLVPRTSDHPLVHWAGRSYYDDLIAHGVRFFEYQPALLHAKMLIIDDNITMIGSTNADIRSFHDNFEINVVIYGQEFALRVTQIFMEDLARSKELTTAYLKRSVRVRLLENALRLASPLL